jgi:peroxiredoxin
MAQNEKAVTEVKGLAVGSKGPRFTATDAEGKKYNLEKALKKGPVVLLFYRGPFYT